MAAGGGVAGVATGGWLAAAGGWLAAVGGWLLLAPSGGWLVRAARPSRLRAAMVSSCPLFFCALSKWRL